MALETDILTYLLNNPQYVPLGVMAFSGYVLFAALYRKTRYWEEFSGTERAFLGGVLGILIGVLLIAPIVQVMLFWIVGTQAVVVNIASAFVSVLVAAEIFAIRISGAKETGVLRYFYGAILVVSAFSGLTCLFAGIVSFSSASYDKYVVLFVQPLWNNFFGTCLLAFFLSTFVLVLFGQTIVRTLKDTLESDVGTLRIHLGTRGKTSHFKIFRAFLGRKSVRFLLALVVVVTVLSALIVPLDQSRVLFTPKLVAGHESFYATEACPGDVYSQLLLIRTSDGVNEFYQKMQSSYNLTLPSLERLVAFVSVQNPSNFSAYVAGDSYYTPWNNLLPSSSSDISFSFTRNNGKVTSIVANLTAVTNATAQFSVSYYNEFLKSDVKVSEFDNSTRIDNATTLETITFIITNDDRFCLTIPKMEVEKLMYEGVNASLAKVYLNGQVLSNTYVGGGLIYPWVTVSPQITANITVTFPKRSAQV
jgi:hypothetical protein